jgi:hypothetical protein
MKEGRNEGTMKEGRKEERKEGRNGRRKIKEGRKDSISGNRPSFQSSPVNYFVQLFRERQ